ncbi:hypothetical protein EZS27_025442 [termite gut metagenome]|uniref:Uncharacterized protein n=1 Tax=termite gut metagenome TaxID=433724 RepID=A0A5J4QWT6_9ZZZZ
MSRNAINQLVSRHRSKPSPTFEANPILVAMNRKKTTEEAIEKLLQENQELRHRLEQAHLKIENDENCKSIRINTKHCLEEEVVLDRIHSYRKWMPRMGGTKLPYLMNEAGYRISRKNLFIILRNNSLLVLGGVRNRLLLRIPLKTNA